MPVITQAQGGVLNLNNPVLRKKLANTQLNTGDWNILANEGTALSTPKNAAAKIFGPGYGFVILREAYHDGSMCLAWFFGTSVVIINQSATSYSNTTTPAADKIGLYWDAGNNGWYAKGNWSSGLDQAYWQAWGVQIA